MDAAETKVDELYALVRRAWPLVPEQTVTRVPHPKFGKIVKQMKKFYAHDEQNEAKTGDTVRIMETRPLSATKRWRVVEILEKAK